MDISAKTGEEGIDELLEKYSLESEVMGRSQS
jgi:hypothetical protein